MTASDAELHFLSATAQGELIRTRRFSPVTLVRASLDRIERYKSVFICDLGALCALCGKCF